MVVVHQTSVMAVPDAAERAPAHAGAWWAWIGLAAAGLATAPPYVGPALVVAKRVEVIDHVVPALTVALASVGALAFGRSRSRPAASFLASGLGIALAGFWMVATHLPLLLQAQRGGAPRMAAAWHSTPGLLTLVLGLTWSARAYRSADPVERNAGY